jgi:hypothetical protein
VAPLFLGVRYSKFCLMKILRRRCVESARIEPRDHLILATLADTHRRRDPDQTDQRRRGQRLKEKPRNSSVSLDFTLTRLLV